MTSLVFLLDYDTQDGTEGQNVDYSVAVEKTIVFFDDLAALIFEPHRLLWQRCSREF